MDFTEQQLVKRSNDLKQLEKLYPNIPYNWLEMTWNFCEKTPEEEHRINYGRKKTLNKEF
jgi:hypothetical protein